MSLKQTHLDLGSSDTNQIRSSNTTNYTTMINWNGDRSYGMKEQQKKLFDNYLITSWHSNLSRAKG